MIQDTSFIDLLKEENLSKINIDKRLHDVFKIVMKNFQRKFNYLGYTKERNYKDFFEKYLLTSNLDDKISIECDKKPDKFYSDGYYNYYDRKIVVNEKLLASKTDLIATLTHEFIHFLVTDYIMEKNEYMKVNIFLEEALTESLKMKILPLSFNSYLFETSFLNFWLRVNDKKINYSNFLSKGAFYDMDTNLLNLLDEYIMSEKIDYKEFYFIKAQRYLINKLDINIFSIEEYENIIYKVEGRVLDDTEFINKFYKKLDKILMNNLEINNILKDEFIKNLEKYRLVVELLVNKNNFKNTFYLETDTHTYKIDKNRNLFKDGRFIKKVNKLNYKDNGKVKEINFTDIDFNRIKMTNEYYKNELIRIKEELKNNLIYIQEEYKSKKIKKFLKM